MKHGREGWARRSSGWRGWLVGMAFMVLGAGRVAVAAENHPVTGEFDGLGQAVLTMLRTHQVGEFAYEVSPTAEDWQALLATNEPPDLQQRFQLESERAEYLRQKMRLDAVTMLAQADQLHLDFTRGDWRFQVESPGPVTEWNYGVAPGTPGPRSPKVNKLDIILTRGAAGSDGAGRFRVTLHDLLKMAGGWRVSWAVRWTEIPANVADEPFRRNLSVVEKTSLHEPLTGGDDPSLQALGEALARFVRTRDTNALVRDAFQHLAEAETISRREGLPNTRAGLLGAEAYTTSLQLLCASHLLAQLDAAGVDLSPAEVRVKSVGIGYGSPRGPRSDPVEIRGRPFKLVLSVESPAKTKGGVSISGDYVLAARAVTRVAGRWMIEPGSKFRWDTLPSGILDPATVAATKVENYAEDHGELPPGAAVPELACTNVADGRELNLAELRGKVVVLDFWATWCGPCQEPVEALQSLRRGHPDWGDRVAVVTMSIDNELGLARRHLEDRGWTNTVNLWAGIGMWSAENNFKGGPSFHLNHVPETYVIDPQGRVIQAGFFEPKLLAKIVDDALEPAAPK